MRRFTCMWFIENFSYCWHDRGQEITSPKFFVEIMQFTSWNLKIYPRANVDPNFIGLGFKRCADCNGPKTVKLRSELSILDANGIVLESKIIEEEETGIEKGVSTDFLFFLERVGNNLGKIDEILTSDIIRVCCVLSRGEGKNIEEEDFMCARTRIAIEKISFIRIIEKFSTLQPNNKKSFDVTSFTNDKIKFSGNIFVKHEPDSGDEIMVEILPGSENTYFITCQMYLISSSGNEIECGKIDTRNYIEKMDTFCFPTNVKKNLLDGKVEYLSNDNLTLRCECTFSTGIEFERIEKTIYDLHVTPFLREHLRDSNFSSFQAGPNSVLNDLENLYKDHILSDFQLQTSNKAFPAHKSVLCARSPIFRAMLTTDMKEKLTGCIQVDDLDDDTIAQFLHFLYTDVVEDLQWESAMKLYYAADKYQVQRLKSICTYFFITRLNARNMVELLILADRHNDSDLKTTVQEFICKRRKIIFCTDKWEDFMETNPILAMKTMHYYLKHSRD